MTRAHSPAPWTLGDENNACCSVSAGGTSISLNRMDELGHVDNVISREEMLANAHLVIASPDLLALVEALTCYELYRKLPEDFRARVTEALKKVEGTT